MTDLDLSVLTPDQVDTIQEVTAKFDRVRETNGADNDALIACARAASWGIFEQWPSAIYAEYIFAMGGRAAADYWDRTHDTDIRASLLGIRDALVRNGWENGGPTFSLDPGTAARIMRAGAEFEAQHGG